MKKKIAAIRIRGNVGLDYGIKKTLGLLRLYRKNYCSVYEDSSTIRGMLNKVKDHITYGELSEDVFRMLVDKRGEDFRGEKNCLIVDNRKLKPYFRLSPPIGGFERKGIKTPYSLGGALGYRAEKINDLIIKML